MDEISPEDAQARVRAVFGNIVEVQSITSQENEDSDSDSDADVVELLTRICYFYPQYKLEDAENLTNAEATALLIQAERQRAIGYYNLTLISAAPHTKDGKLVDELIKQYKEIALL